MKRSRRPDGPGRAAVRLRRPRGGRPRPFRARLGVRHGPAAAPLADGGDRAHALPGHDEGPRGAGVVRPGEHPPPLVLVRGGGALVPLVPEARARQRHGVLGPRADRPQLVHRPRARQARREAGSRLPEGRGEAEGVGLSARADVHRGVGRRLHRRVEGAGQGPRPPPAEDRARVSRRRGGEGALRPLLDGRRPTPTRPSWSSGRCSRRSPTTPARTTTGSTTGTTSPRPRGSRAAGGTARWCPASATPTTCRGTTTARSACGTRRRSRWTRRPGSSCAT